MLRGNARVEHRDGHAGAGKADVVSDEKRTGGDVGPEVETVHDPVGLHMNRLRKARDVLQLAVRNVEDVSADAVETAEP